MPHYTYIIKCADETYYVGMTGNLRNRITSHNSGNNSSTKNRIPAKLLFFAGFPNKSKAAEFEKYLKSHSGRAFAKKHLI